MKFNFAIVNFKSMMTKFLKSIFATIAIALLANLVACSVISDSRYEVAEEQKPDSYDDVLVSTSDLPLFTDFGGLLTRSSTMEEDNSSDTQLVTLESLLDMDNTISKTFKHYVLKEIPFKSNESPSYAVLSGGSVTNAVSSENLSEISLFLIETTDTVKNTIDRKVVTMIPDREYADKFTGERWSFIDKGVFSGAILFSNLDGSYRNVYVYGGDFCPIIDADVIDESDRASYSRSGFLSVVSILGTKTGTELSDGGILIEGSICIAERTIVERMNANASTLINYGDIDWWSGSVNPTLGGGGGGGGSSSAVSSGAGSGISLITDTSSGSSSANTTPTTAAGSYWGSTPTVYMRVEDIQNYTVSLYSTEGGMTSGSGTYQTGTYIMCQAYADSSYIFDRWTGDFKGMTDFISLQVCDDIEATAYFRYILETGQIRPCLDVIKGIMNPLIDMSLAPSNTWSKNFKGVTFGMTRYEEDKNTHEIIPKMHNGLDLYAEPGTPIFSMFDGVIDESYVIEQPMRIGNRKYPKGYSGDVNDAGNRIYVNSNVNGENISVGYWHLSANNPVAINPRTGRPYAVGDMVYQGEIIAYAGRTGNANRVPYAHLHLSIKKNGLFVDPMLYINGHLDSTGAGSQILVSSTEIRNIICDNEQTIQ